jgi:hypothetical protein
MLIESPSALRRIVTSLKVVALATVLGTVVLAAERHMATRVSPDEAISAEQAPSRLMSDGAAASAQSPMPANMAAPDAYFPSQFPEPSGPADEEQPPTF